MRTIKELLGIRQQTCTNIVHVESGIPDINTFIEQKQTKFISKLKASSHFPNSPAELALNLAHECRCSMAINLQRLPHTVNNMIEENISYHAQEIRVSNSTKRQPHST